jgi:hypothetical protein
MCALDSNKKKESERAEGGLTYDLTYKDVVDILEVIEQSTCRELHVESGDLKLTVVKRW